MAGMAGAAGVAGVAGAAIAAAIVGAGFKPVPTYEMDHTHGNPSRQPQAEGRAGIDRHETSLNLYPLLRLPIPPNAARLPCFMLCGWEFLRWKLQCDNIVEPAHGPPRTNRRVTKIGGTHE